MLKALRGTKDILPAEMGPWLLIEQYARDMFPLYGYKEIRTPIIEEASLFSRSIGEYTDIVKKEMYAFSDRGGRTIALRPEGTTSIVRAYLENSLSQGQGLVKLFYIGPMFRSERPQKGRQRQFHQLGIEAIGSDNPFLDVEVIAVAVRFLEKIGVKDFCLRINSLGCKKDKINMIEKTRQRIKDYVDSLCGECQERYKKNVLRIFDCKRDSCREAIKDVTFETVLCDDCNEHFNAVKEGLERIRLAYVYDPKVVRGLDYYTKTVFEITQEDLGAKDAVSAGGRYNNLIKELGGKHTPAIGFSFGIERLILALERHSMALKSPPNIFILTTGPALYKEAFMVMDVLRRRGISCDIDYQNRSLKAQMRNAERSNVRFAVIFGDEEFCKNKVILRDMEKREQKEVELKDIVDEINREVAEKVPKCY